MTKRIEKIKDFRGNKIGGEKELKIIPKTRFIHI